MAEGGQKRQKPSAVCHLLDEANTCLVECMCRLQKIESDWESVSKLGKCTVEFDRSFDMEEFKETSEKVLALVKSMQEVMVAHAEKHPAAKRGKFGSPPFPKILHTKYSFVCYLSNTHSIFVIMKLDIYLHCQILLSFILFL